MTLRLTSIVAVALAAGPAYAGGQFVGDNGSEGMARAGAFVAKADDPTALYYNPAGLLNASTQQLFFGVNVVGFDQSFQRFGEYQPQTIDPGEAQPEWVGDPYPAVANRGKSQPIPFLSFTRPAGRYALGIGVFAPHGYGGRDFPTTVQSASSDEAPAPQRYDAVSQTGLVVFPSAGAAVRLNDRLNFGVRASWAYAHIRSTKYVQGVPNRGEEPGRDTAVTIDAKDPFAFAYGLGVHFRQSEFFELAATYQSAVSFAAKGTSVNEPGVDLLGAADENGNLILPVPDEQARCAPGGTVDHINACLYFSLPQAATVGARWIARNEYGEETGDFEIDARWENWSAASTQRVVIDGASVLMGGSLGDTVLDNRLDDVYSLRAGGSRSFHGDERSLHLRGGVAYDTAATPTSWTSLSVDGGPRVTVAAGIGVSFSRTRIDLGAAHIQSTSRRVDQVPVPNTDDVGVRQQPDVSVPLLPPEDLPYHPINSGQYEASYTIISAGLTRSW